MSQTTLIGLRPSRGLLSRRIEEIRSLTLNGEFKDMCVLLNQYLLTKNSTHRLRTQQYIRELEKEVLRLRDNEQMLENRVHQLVKQTEVFQQLLSKDGGHQPAVEPHSVLSSGEPTPLTLNGTTERDMVRVNLQELESAPSVGSCQVVPMDIGPTCKHSGGPSMSSFPTFPTSQGSGNSKSTLITQIGLDFVLALERPCLPHIKHYHVPFIEDREPAAPRIDIEYNSGPAHSFNVGAQLLHNHYQMSSSTDFCPFNASATQIEHLFKASLSLPLTGEMTPVQVWKHMETALSAHSNDNDKGAWSSRIQLVEAMRNELAQYAYCNSFGAVLREEDVGLVIHKHGIASHT